MCGVSWSPWRRRYTPTSISFSRKKKQFFFVVIVLCVCNECRSTLKIIFLGLFLIEIPFDSVVSRERSSCSQSRVVTVGNFFFFVSLVVMYLFRFLARRIRQK